MTEEETPVTVGETEMEEGLEPQGAEPLAEESEPSEPESNEIPVSENREQDGEEAESTSPEKRRRRRAERRVTDRIEMEAAIEAVLFVSSEPVPREKLLALFDEDEREEATAALEAVMVRYASSPERGLMAEEVAGGIRLATRPELVGWLRRFFEVSSANKLSVAALETLAIIAYRQPITGPEIQELRGVSASGVLKTLLEKRLLRITGRKEVVGKPFLYSTTREFLVHFGLKSLADLPPLEEFEETFGEAGFGAAGAPGDSNATISTSDLSTADLSTADERREEEFHRAAEVLAERQERTALAEREIAKPLAEHHEATALEDSEVAAPQEEGDET